MRKAEEAKQLTKRWRMTKKVRPSREWVIDELERLQVRIVSSRRSSEEIQKIKGSKTKGTKKTNGGSTRASKTRMGKSGTSSSSSSTSPNDVYAKQYGIAEKRIRRVSYVNSKDDDKRDFSATKRARTAKITDVETTCTACTATPAEPMTFTASLTNTPTTGDRVMARRSSSLNLVASILNSTDFGALFGEGPGADSLGTDTAATAITRSETFGPASLSNSSFSFPNIDIEPSNEDLDHDTMSDLSDSSTRSSPNHDTRSISPIPTEQRSLYAPSIPFLEILSSSNGTGGLRATRPSTLCAPPGSESWLLR